MFKLRINKVIFFAYMIDSNYDLWHARLSHINTKYVQNMSKSGLIPKISHNNSKCEICLKCKMTKKPFPNERTSQLLEIIHFDSCELNSHLTRGGNKYFITFIDDHSRYTNLFDEIKRSSI
jgi:hypothetical protein